MKHSAAIGATVIVASLSGCGVEVMYADWKIDQLCKKDGGVTALIHDKAPAELLKSNGAIDVDALLRDKPERSYFLTNALDNIQTDEPRMFRSEYRLYRRADNALLGTSVVYHRVGQNTSIPLLSRRAYKCPAGNELARLVDSVFGASERIRQ